MEENVMTDSMQPLYQQIYSHLKEDILTQKYSSGKRLPTEKEICEMFHVSRITSKKALNMLAEEKLIVRIKGRGSYVPQDKKSEYLKKQDKTKVIGIIMPDFDDAFGRDILLVVEKCCRDNGVMLLISRSADAQQYEQQAINDMIAFGVTGILIVPIHGVYYNKKILQLVLDGFPIVVIDRDLRGIPVHFVGTDNESAARAGMDYLIEAGHRKIGIYTPPHEKTSTLKDRLEGVHQSLEKNNLLLESSLFLDKLYSTVIYYNVSEGYEKDKETIKAHILEHKDMTAVFAMGYSIAIMTRNAVEELGLSVPNDVSIICFDGPTQLPFNWQTFTHIRQNQQEIGKLAFDLIFSIAEGKSGENAIKTNLPATLVSGQSVKNINT